MPRIDIGAVLADKAPRLARWIPGFVIGWLRRTIHESEINYILEHYWNLPPQEFIRACFREWQVTYTVEGLEKLDPKGRYLFAANHPFGGMDGMMLADKLIDRFGDARVVVNDLLMHLEPLRPLWIPVNKHGSQNSAYARKFDEEFVGEVPILTFPAGLCSRCIGGEVTDLPWKTNFLKKAYASQREIVPVFVEGRLSNFFYRVARLRVMYIFSAAECPSLMREIGRLREIAFRGAGGGTGKELDIDAEDLAEDGYYQLIVWDPAAEEIVGGYRFIICTDEYPRHLSTEHYFRFSDKFRRKYLPRTIELGRSFVQPSYQARGNAKSIYALDNLWDGLGALIVLDPRAKYLFGKVTMYTTYKAVARNALIWFLRRYFPDRDNLVEGIHPLRLDLDDPYYEQLFTGQTYQENYRILIQKIREFNENIPPLINAYMNLSPTMRVFDTVSNPDFGGVEETGILVTIRDIYPEKRERYTRWLGWQANLQYRRELFRKRVREHLDRIKKRKGE